jgi:hypothetical protein
MTPIKIDVRDLHSWMAIHNYAKTMISCRCRYLRYFVDFAAAEGFERSEDVTLELLASYQQSLFAHSRSPQARRHVPFLRYPGAAPRARGPVVLLVAA